MATDNADKPEKVSPIVALPVQHSTSARAGHGDAAFNQWLEQGLQAMYGGIAREPIPPALLALIERNRHRPR